MSIFETLKKFAQILLDAINKKKEEKQKNEEVKKLMGYGSIEGPNIPYNSDYCFAHECLIIRSGYEHKFFCEIDIIKDIASFSFVSKFEHELDNTSMISYSFKLTLKNGDELKLSLVMWKHANPDTYALMSEKITGVALWATPVDKKSVTAGGGITSRSSRVRQLQCGQIRPRARPLPPRQSEQPYPERGSALPRVR